MPYNIISSYNRKYITGNAPYGIFIEYDDYKTLDDVKKKFIEVLNVRKGDNDFEFGWELEYRLAIVETSPDQLLSNIKSEQFDIKISHPGTERKGLLDDYINLLNIINSRKILYLLESDYKDDYWNNQLKIYNNIAISNVQL